MCVSNSLKESRSLDQILHERGASTPAEKRRRESSRERAPRVEQPQAPLRPSRTRAFEKPTFEVNNDHVVVYGCPIHGENTHLLHQCEALREQAALVQLRRRPLNLDNLQLPWWPTGPTPGSRLASVWPALQQRLWMDRGVDDEPMVDVMGDGHDDIDLDLDEWLHDGGPKPTQARTGRGRRRLDDDDLGAGGGRKKPRAAKPAKRGPTGAAVEGRSRVQGGGGGPVAAEESEEGGWPEGDSGTTNSSGAAEGARSGTSSGSDSSGGGGGHIPQVRQTTARTQALAAKQIDRPSGRERGGMTVTGVVHPTEGTLA
ncbi:hypothetical protein PLESTB_000274200 [Pleodorina starrii]|uniref:Uncharacterized protein n=1 Tax=Pleodorina starrii TaxID=330485 RepID=A0A9W6BDD7_9CHLO|nr:hypothetical protein PLESTB_000274200 [Pleodorina starrii]GLC65517.1 hypothetical protein PLESTF_000305200 [Pleodorina starrii]